MNTWLLETRLRTEFLAVKKDEIVKELVNLTNDLCECSVIYKKLELPWKILLSNESEFSVFIQVQVDGLLTADVSKTGLETGVTDNTVEIMRAKLREMHWTINFKTPDYPFCKGIKRGEAFSTYESIYSGIVVRDYDSVVFDHVSNYQQVRIMHSPQYGNVLYLDNDLNLAESDLAYTRAITGNDMEDYSKKTVLILGGGDGGILHYLKDKDPAMITMIDIDQVVIDAAKIHLRGICHDAMDATTGPNYEIIVDDCVKYLESYVVAGKKFDYVINDLTAIPINTEAVGDHWIFLRLILNLSMKVLADNGKYFTQGNSASCTKALAIYEEQLKKLEDPVRFTKETVCVPSYLELWVFYKIWKMIDTPCNTAI